MSTHIEMTEEDTQIQQDSDEEIQEHHNLERENLVQQVTAHAKKPTCRKMICKGLILSVAGVLFLLMMIQLWSDYGDYIQTQTFPPKLISMGRYCSNMTNRTDIMDRYNPLNCVYLDRYECSGVTKPNKYYIQACPHSKITWEDENLYVEPYVERECVDLTVWSI